MVYNRQRLKMKTTAKRMFWICVLFFGTYATSNAQFLEFLNKAVNTVNQATETYNNARDSYNNVRDAVTNSQKSNEPTYRNVGYVTLRYRNTFNGSVTSEGSSSADIVEDESGNKYVKKNGNRYAYRRNNLYDEYSSEFIKRYEYMVTIDGQTYFFDM